MSLEAFKWAKTVRNVSPMEQHLLIWIADFYNDAQGMAYPSRKTLSDSSKISIRSISRLSAALEEKGLLWVQFCINSHNGKNLNNRYFLPRYAPHSMVGDLRKTAFLTPEYERETGRVIFRD